MSTATVTLPPITSYEKIPTSIFPTSAEACTAVAFEIACLIREKQQLGENVVLGLATGSTPKKVYDELILLHRNDGLLFFQCNCF